MKKVLRYLVFALIAAFFIYMAFRNVKFVELWDKIRTANFIWIGLAWAAGMMSNVSRAIRWTYIMQPLGFSVSKMTSFHGVMVGYLVNFAIPRGGEVTRAAMLSRVEKIALPTVLGSIVAERVMDLICMGLVILFALAVQYDTIMGFLSGSGTGTADSGEKSDKTWLIITGAVLFILFIVFLIYRKKLDKYPLFHRINLLLMSFGDGVKAIFKLKRPIAFIIHSVVIWVMYFFMVYFCFYAIPETSSLGTAAGLTVLVLSTLAVVLPAPGGIGTFHYFVSKGLIIYGIAEADGLAYATIAHASQMIMFILFGSISLVMMLLLQRKTLTK